ncbi:MAG: LysE family transporter [Muribaculaceae bacterium]
MPQSVIATLLLQILVVGYTPGPANVYALAMSMRHGKRAALVMWCGLLAGFSAAAVTLALLTHLIGEAVGQYLFYLKYVGAAYLLWLAYGLARGGAAAGDAGSGECTFVSGMLVQLTNAKILMFDLMVYFTYVLPYGNRLTSLLEAAAWLLLAGPGANLLWLLAGAFLRRFFVRYQRSVEVGSAIALAACAVYVIV